MLAAKSVAYSAGASGTYLVSMFEKLGISEQVKIVGHREARLNEWAMWSLAARPRSASTS